MHDSYTCDDLLARIKIFMICLEKFRVKTAVHTDELASTLAIHSREFKQVQFYVAAGFIIVNCCDFLSKKTNMKYPRLIMQ